MKWTTIFQDTMIFLTSVIYSVDLCSACPCTTSHPQYNFCKADYAIKATITERRLISDTEAPLFDRLIYNITVHTVYKAPPNLPTGLLANVFSSNPNHDTCGVYLQVGETYLITGHIRSDGLSVSTCDWIAVYSRMSFIQIMGIRGDYNQSCNCMRSHPTTYESLCHDRHGVLIEFPDRTCRWRVDMTQQICSGELMQGVLDNV